MGYLSLYLMSLNSPCEWWSEDAPDADTEKNDDPDEDVKQNYKNSIVINVK